MSRIKKFSRLRSSKTFERIYRRPDKRWHTPWFALFYQNSSDFEVGFVASKKVGKAVERNRARRLLRAQIISVQKQMLPGRYILVAKAPILESNFEEVSSALQKALKRFKLLRTEESI